MMNPNEKFNDTPLERKLNRAERRKTLKATGHGDNNRKPKHNKQTQKRLQKAC